MIFAPPPPPSAALLHPSSNLSFSSRSMEVLGWSPSGDFEEVNVYNFFQTPLDHPLVKTDTSSDVFLPPLAPPPPSPSSSAHYHQKTAGQRRRDPDHIPRPRNSFIIFRCDYTRQHCNGTGERESTDAEKRSLSKRAGEAWKNVPADVKKHYKRLADHERDEHARRNPDYRFRPKRRSYSAHSAKPAPPPKVEPTESGSQPLMREDSRSRSSSLSSLGSTPSDLYSISPSICSSISTIGSGDYPSPSPCPSSPEVHLTLPATSPQTPYTPLDTPSEHGSYFAKCQAQGSFVRDLDNAVVSDYDDKQLVDLLCGNLSPSISSDCFLPFVEDQPMPSQIATISATDQNIPPPITMVASSLAGWNGSDTSFSLSSIDSEDILPFFAQPSLFQYGHQHLSPEMCGSLDDCGLSTSTTADILSFDSAVQSNLDAYAMGLSDCGIDFNGSGFDLSALSS